jgi:sporulation protein YlmC with PRC-barrel domain
MLSIGLTLEGYAIEATDGTLGAVSDILFDDKTWMVRWIVVDTGPWLTGRKVLIHPSSLGRPDHDRRELPVALTKAQVKDSPDIATDDAVSRHMQNRIYGYYGWDPLWAGAGYLGATSGGFGLPFPPSAYDGETATLSKADLESNEQEGDPDLRSITAVSGYHVLATDGAIGHVENILIDDTTWRVRYIAVDTKNWLPGRHVLILPDSVAAISWLDRSVQVDLSRDKIMGSPVWTPDDIGQAAYRQRLHDYYGWPSYAA